jgi:hypothetical protein
MNIINFKFFEGIFDLVCVMEGWMNLRFYLRFFMKKSVITLLKYVTIFNENNAQIIILEFRAR